MRLFKRETKEIYTTYDSFSRDDGGGGDGTGMFSVKIFPENLSGSTAERHVGVVDRYERKIGH